MKYVFLILSVIFLLGCEEDDNFYGDPPGELIGYWINPVEPENGSNTIIFERSTALKENDYSIAFHEGNQLIYRAHTGFCATPPLSYDDWDGTWSIQDSIVHINVEYWGGTIEIDWKLISVTESTLTLEYIYD